LERIVATNIGKDCSNKSFSLKKKEEEEKKGCTKNVPLFNESDLQTRWRQEKCHFILGPQCCAVPVCDTSTMSKCIAENGKVTGE